MLLKLTQSQLWHEKIDPFLLHQQWDKNMDMRLYHTLVWGDLFLFNINHWMRTFLIIYIYETTCNSTGSKLRPDISKPPLIWLFYSEWCELYHCPKDTRIKKDNLWSPQLFAFFIVFPSSVNIFRPGFFSSLFQLHRHYDVVYHRWLYFCWCHCHRNSNILGKQKKFDSLVWTGKSNPWFSQAFSDR